MMKRNITLTIAFLSALMAQQTHAFGPLGKLALRTAGVATGATIGLCVTTPAITDILSLTGSPAGEAYISAAIVGLPIGILGGGLLGFKGAQYLLKPNNVQKLVKYYQILRKSTPEDKLK